MEYHYVVIDSILKDVSHPRRCYGIALVSDYEGTPVVLETVFDVSSDRQQIERLVALCNDLKIDPIHLSDVLDDYLAY